MQSERVEQIGKLISVLPNYQRTHIAARTRGGVSRLEVLVRLIRLGIEREGALSLEERRWAAEVRRTGLSP